MPDLGLQLGTKQLPAVTLGLLVSLTCVVCSAAVLKINTCEFFLVWSSPSALLATCGPLHSSVSLAVFLMSVTAFQNASAVQMKHLICSHCERFNN